MEERVDSEGVSNPNLSTSRMDTKTIGEKRGSDVGDGYDDRCKRVKMHGLDSGSRFDEIDRHDSEDWKHKEASDEFWVGQEALTQVSLAPEVVDLAVSVTKGTLDLNAEAWISKNAATADNQDATNRSGVPCLLGRSDKTSVKSTGIDLNLNVEDDSSVVNQEVTHPSGKTDRLKLRDVSECASSADPVREKDALRIWKEMKQNGFLSSSHGGIPIPKQRGRKSKNDVLKKKMELAKKEQIDKFTKLAAPSGLLNELNPGIINHVRNRKQVHSIIEALVKSEEREKRLVSGKESTLLESGHGEVTKAKNPENRNDYATQGLSSVQGHGPSRYLVESMGIKGNPLSICKNSLMLGSEEESECMMSGRMQSRSGVSHSTSVIEDTLALKLSSSSNFCESASHISKEDSDSVTCVSSLSVKAASVASQWLELLHQDVKGRISALRRSKKRVQAVMTTDLPSLAAKEFSSNQENDPHGVNMNLHQTRWARLFEQMDQALSDEEKQLEKWLNQVKDMQFQCDQGLHHVHFSASTGLPALVVEATQIDSRPWLMNSLERELAVGAAAASIYSTCNYLTTEKA